MGINPNQYSPLFLNGKRDKARRYTDASGHLISRRSYDAASGKLASRPSSQPTKRATGISGVSGTKSPLKPKSRRLEGYNQRVKSYAKQHSMMIQDVKRDANFKQLNKSIASDLTSLHKNEQKLSSDLSSLGIASFSGELTEARYMRISENIANSSLSVKQKEKLYNQMNKIREQRIKLGDKFRQVGLKDANDFSALGETIKV